jgi:hypothetical protein
MPPEQPDLYFRLTQRSDGEGRPDVAVLVPESDDAVIKVFRNHGGTFRDRPDHAIHVPGISSPVRLRVRRLNDDRAADFLVGAVPRAWSSRRG